jgi:hypothetical protein
MRPHFKLYLAHLMCQQLDMAGDAAEIRCPGPRAATQQSASSCRQSKAARHEVGTERLSSLYGLLLVSAAIVLPAQTDDALRNRDIAAAMLSIC